MLKSKKCDLIIGDSAFKPAYSTLQELTISHTHLGSDHKAFLHFLSNLKHFKNLSRLNIQDNMIQSIDHCMVPQSVKTMDISRNNFTCNSSTVNELKCLKEKAVLDLKKEKYPCLLQMQSSENVPIDCQCKTIFEETSLITQTNVPTTVFVIIISTVVIIFIVVSIICCRRNAKRTSRASHMPLQQIDLHEECVFDIFISYAPNDTQIMEQMFQNLVNNSTNGHRKGLKVSFNDKDFVPGKSLKQYIIHI